MRLFMLVAWLCTLALGAAAAAEDRIRTVNLDAAPWSGDCADSPCIADAIFEEIGRRLDMPVDLSSSLPGDIFAALETGVADFTLMFWSDRLAAVAEQEAVAFDVVVGVRGAPKTRFTRLEDLFGKRIGVLPGARYEAAFDAADAIEKVEGPYAELIPAAASGALDGVAGPMPSLAWAERTERVRLRGWLKLRTEPVMLARSKTCDCAALAARIAETLDAMHAEGFVDKLLRDHRVIH